MATGLGHAKSLITDQVDVLIVGLGVETRALIDAVREQMLTAVDPGMAIIALTPAKRFSIGCGCWSRALMT